MMLLMHHLFKQRLGNINALKDSLINFTDLRSMGAWAEASDNTDSNSKNIYLQRQKTTHGQ